MNRRFYLISSYKKFSNQFSEFIFLINFFKLIKINFLNFN